MAEPAKEEKAKSEVLDEGIEVGASRLTPEKIERVINSVLKGETGARFKAYIETCIHCGLCSEACHYYLSHDKDPRFSPGGQSQAGPVAHAQKEGACRRRFYQTGGTHRPHRMQPVQTLCPCTAPSGSTSPI
jgi:ferredoxin